MDSQEQAAARTQHQQQSDYNDDDDDLGGSRPLPTEVDHPILRSLAEKTKLAFTRLSLAPTIDEEVELEDGPASSSSRNARLLDAVGRRTVVIMLIVVGTLAMISTYIFSIRQDHKDFEKQVRWLRLAQLTTLPSSALGHSVFGVNIQPHQSLPFIWFPSISLSPHI